MDNLIKNISATIAAILVFFLAGSFYLTMKGFVFDEENGFVLKNAYAEEETKKEIPMNFAFPQDHVLGNNNAKITIYEYSSFGCSHCADMHLEVMPEVIKKYVDNGSLRIVFVPLPLEKKSMDAALLAECVAKDKYFDFVNILFKHQRDWMMAFDAMKELRKYAALSGIGKERAEVCLHDDKIAARILGDRKNGLSELGIKGTPTFIISSKHGNEALTGSMSFEEISEVLDRHIKAVYN